MYSIDIYVHHHAILLWFLTNFFLYRTFHIYRHAEPFTVWFQLPTTEKPVDLMRFRQLSFASIRRVGSSSVARSRTRYSISPNDINFRITIKIWNLINMDLWYSTNRRKLIFQRLYATMLILTTKLIDFHFAHDISFCYTTLKPQIQYIKGWSWGTGTQECSWRLICIKLLFQEWRVSQIKEYFFILGSLSTSTITAHGRFPSPTTSRCDSYGKHELVL